MDLVKTIGGVKVYREQSALVFKAGATVNGDGSPHCYHPIDDEGLDYLANAGSPGNWWGIYTDRQGNPVLQSIYHPAPGYYISTTALVNPTYPEDHPEHYIDSERYPFCVVPGSFGEGWKLGDVGFCLNERTRDNMYCATADVGPTNHIGEVSMLLAKCLGLDFDPKTGGTESGIVYVIFPGSDPVYRSWMEKCEIAIEAFDKWGGTNHLEDIIDKL
jgi:Fungal chitosanase of glycosyl hydrolase group 75